MRFLSHRAFAGLLAVLVLAIAARLYGLEGSLPDVYEEATPLKKAWEMWGFQTGRLDPNPRFFNYPSFTIYLQFLAQGLLRLGLAVTGRATSALDLQAVYSFEPTPFYLAGRAVTALLGAGTVLATFLLGRRFAGVPAGLLAALLLAVNPFHVGKSQLIEVDVPLTFFVTLALWTFLRVMDAPTRKRAAIAGIAAGLAIGTKYTGALLAVPAGLALAFAYRGEPARTGPPIRDSGVERGGRSLLVTGAILAATTIMTFLATSPFVVLDHRQFLQDFLFEREHMDVGHFGVDRGPGWAFYGRLLAGTLPGWPAVIAAGASILILAGFRRRRDTLVPVVFVAAYMAAVGSWSMKADRYLLPVVPVLLVLAAVLPFALPEAARRIRPGAVRIAAVTVFAALLAAPSVAGWPVLIAARAVDTRTEARLWIEANVEPGTLIASELHGPALFSPLQFWALDPALRERFRSERPRRIFPVQMIPMFGVRPGIADPFYDPDLYRDADLIITSSTVRGRYLREPGRFPRQIAFYDSLDASFELLRAFPGSDLRGPTITIYRNPAHLAALAERDSVSGPVLLEGLGNPYSGEEAYFYYNLALNYELGGHLDAAVHACVMGLELPPIKPRVVTGLAWAGSRILLNQGRRDEVAAFLERAAGRAPADDDREAIEALGRDAGVF